MKVLTFWEPHGIWKNLPHGLYVCTKGQLISKCPFGVSKSSKKTNKIVSKISALGSKKRSYQKSSVRETT